MAESPRRNWNREETLLAFRLYCRLPFGKLHKTNPQIVALAQRLGRTPSAVGMKACNFASLDPHHRQRGVRALANRSALDDLVWAEFVANPEAVAAEAEAAGDQLGLPTADDGNPPFVPPTGETETERTVRARRVQGFFRSAVLTSYGGRCALSGLAVAELLNASHIIPWAASVERRADPRNGLCLNALLDRAFDRGLISFDGDLSVIVSPTIAPDSTSDGILLPGGLRGRRIDLPDRFEPDRDALAYHREHVFRH